MAYSIIPILFEIVFSIVLMCSFHIITPRNLKSFTLSIFKLFIEMSGNFNGNESLFLSL